MIRLAFFFCLAQVIFLCPVSAYPGGSSVMLILFDIEATNLSNHQENRWQKDTICVKFDEKNLLPPIKLYHGTS
jgi:hypothetical protein